MKKGIDVSFAQGNVNWSAVKNNVDFAIMRIGFGREVSQTDAQFMNNYTGCKSNGIPCGAFWYSYAESVEDAVLEAKACLAVASRVSPLQIDRRLLGERGLRG